MISKYRKDTDILLEIPESKYICRFISQKYYLNSHTHTYIYISLQYSQTIPVYIRRWLAPQLRIPAKIFLLLAAHAFSCRYSLSTQCASDQTLNV